MKSYVLGFLFSDDGVLLIHKNSGRFKGRHNGLGGSIQEGEQPVAAICREVREESDIDTISSEWTHVATLFDKDYMLWVYAALIPHVWDPVSSNEGEVAFYDTANLPPTLDGTAHWLMSLCSDESIMWPLNIYTSSTQQVREEPLVAGPNYVNAIEGDFANIVATVFGASDGDTVVVPDKHFRAVFNLLIRYEGPDVNLMSKSDRTNEVRQKYPGGRV